MRRLRTLAFLATLLAVGVLIASLVAGLQEDVEGGEPAAVAAVEEAPGATVRVEVLNAAGTPGLARAATRILRERRFDVVYYGNAGRYGRDTSMVIDRAGRLEDAERIAEALRIKRVRSEPNSSLYLEATVVLGRDWEGAEAARRSPPRGAGGGEL